MDGWGRRAALISVVVLAIANVVFWGYVYNRQQKVSPSSFSATLTPTGAPASIPPSSSASPTPSPTPTTTALPLPDVTGRSLKVSIVSDSLGTGRYASGPSSRYRGLMLAALQARGGVTVAEASRNSGALSASQEVPAGLDLVVVELGTDDITATDPNGFEAVYGPLLKSIRLGSPNAALVCAGTWSDHGEAFDSVIEQDCVREQGHFVSLDSLYDDTANRGPAGVSGFYGVSDDLAPNNAGHRAIAEALLAPIGVSLP